MRIVVDSNMLQDRELERFLVAHSQNRAVLPDFVWIEIYKQNRVDAVISALSIIAEFPNQVSILANGHYIAGLDPRCPEFEVRLLHPTSGEDLRHMKVALRDAEAGRSAQLAELAARWSSATSSVRSMTEGADEIAKSLPEMATIFSPDELSRCRTQQPYTSDMATKIFGIAGQIYEAIAEERGVAPLSRPEDALGAYLYRYALGIGIYLLWWIRNGSQIPGRLDKVRNDIIDLGIVVCATYFDGLMTRDAKASWMYRELSNALRFGFANAAMQSATGPR